MDTNNFKQIIDYDLDIIDVLQSYVNKISQSKWKEDDCKPDFWVSLNNEDIKSQSIMISINHNGVKFTEKMFPRLKIEYGYISIENQMKNMYSQTM